MGAQKNRLNETVLLSTQNTCLTSWLRKYSHFYAKKAHLTGPMRKQSSGCMNNDMYLHCILSTHSLPSALQVRMNHNMIKSVSFVTRYDTNQSAQLQ